MGPYSYQARTKGGVRPPLLLLVVVASILGAAALPASGQGRAEPTTPAVEGGVYRRPLGSDPATLDPARISDIFGLSVSQQIVEMHGGTVDVANRDSGGARVTITLKVDRKGAPS